MSNGSDLAEDKSGNDGCVFSPCAPPPVPTNCRVSGVGVTSEVHDALATLLEFAWIMNELGLCATLCSFPGSQKGFVMADVVSLARSLLRACSSAWGGLLDDVIDVKPMRIHKRW